MPKKRGPYGKRPPVLAPPEWRLRNLLGWRTYRGMTQDELAAKAGMSISNVSGLETLRYGFSGEGLVALARALETTPGALLAVNPSEDQGGMIWALWSDATAAQRRQIAEMAAVIVRPQSQ